MSEAGRPNTGAIYDIEVLLEMRDEGMSNRAIAKALGYSRRAVDQRFQRYDRRLAGKKNLDQAIPNESIPGSGRDITKVSTQLDRRGKPVKYNVEERPEKDDFQHAHPLDKLKRVSTYYGPNGEIQGQWQITVDDDHGQKEAFDQIIEELKADLPAILPTPLNTVAKLEDNLHNTYILSDAHIGALAWKPESGADWDLKIAEEMLVKAFETMIQRSAPAKTCSVILLGDWTHYDKMMAETTLSGHVLDSDGRQPKMNKVAIRVARQIVQIALKQHFSVDLLIAEGNHDIVAAPWLRELFSALYDLEPRLCIIDDPRPYYAWMVGDIMQCVHHGHLQGVKNPKDAEKLVAIFADEYREMWGKAKKVYVDTGHFHQPMEFSVRGALVTNHPTLAARDSRAARMGWGNMREAYSFTYHKKYGRVARNTVSPEMLEGL